MKALIQLSTADITSLIEGIGRPKTLIEDIALRGLTEELASRKEEEDEDSRASGIPDSVCRLLDDVDNLDI